MNTIIINLVGGPCCGKSTQAALLFSELKKHGIKTELLTETVKPFVYEENSAALSCQPYIFGLQLYRLKNLVGKCEVIVSDGSLLQNIAYDREANTLFHSFIIQQYNEFKNIDFFLRRDDIPFEQFGRVHDEHQSLDLDNKIKGVYAFANATLIEVSSKNAVEEIINHVLATTETS